MKKKIFGILILGLVVFLPCKVSALDFSTSLLCVTSTSKGATVNCDVGVTVADGSISDIDVVLETSLGTASNYTVAYAGPVTDTASIGTFTFNAGQVVGNAIVKVTSATAKDADDSSIDVTSSNLPQTTVAVLDNNISLTDLTIDGATIGGFSPTKYNYDVTVTKSSITIEATGDTNVDIDSGTGAVALVCGRNSVIVKTKAQDTTPGNYTINVTRSCNATTTLKSLSVSSGSLSPAFSPNTTNYKVEVDSSIDKISFSSTKDNDTQTVTSVENKALVVGDNKFTITVTAENGNTKTYTIVVTRKKADPPTDNKPDDDKRSTDDTLKSLNVSDGNIVFDAATTEYKFKVLYSVEKIVIDAVANDEKAKVEITGGDALVVGDNTITIKVTAEHGEEKIYTVVVTRLNENESLGDNPYAKLITVNGYDLGFKSELYNYTLKIKNEKELNITVVMQDQNAEYSIRGNSDLRNGSIITIVTTSDDGSIITYKINIVKDSMIWIWILIVAVIILLIIFIIMLILKKKKEVLENPKPSKNKEKSKDKSVTTTVVADKSLLDKVEQQIKASEELYTNEDLDGVGETKKVDVITPISILKKEPTSDVALEDQSLRSNRFANIREDSRESVDFEKDIFNDIDTKFESDHVADDESVSKQEEATKVCSICGHRVPISTKVCPYCRRIWK